MSVLSDPTPLQRQVIEDLGDMLVIGSPGTGKTSVALAKAEASIRDEGLAEYQSVLFLSFSNAAVHRIREASRGAIPRRVLWKMETTTFHGLCYSILMTHRRLVGLRKPFRLLPPEEEANLRSRLDSDDLVNELDRFEVEEGRVRLKGFQRFQSLPPSTSTDSAVEIRRSRCSRG